MSKFDRNRPMDEDTVATEQEMVVRRQNRLNALVSQVSELVVGARLDAADGRLHIEDVDRVRFPQLDKIEQEIMVLVKEGAQIPETFVSSISFEDKSGPVTK